MQPRVRKRDKKLHLSYDLSQRIHCSRIYPITAPNGSTVIINGLENGLNVVWRGGRRRNGRQSTERAVSTNNGVTKQQDTVVIDDGIDEEQLTGRGNTRTEATDLFVPEEEEQDPDCPCPAIIQDVNISLPQAVLSLEVPDSTLTSSPLSSPLRSIAVATVLYTNGSVAVLSVPLIPPLQGQDQDFSQTVLQSQIILQPPSALIPQIALKLVSETLSVEKDLVRELELQLLVASVFDTLDVWQLLVTERKGASLEGHPIQDMTLPHRSSHVYFHPSLQSRQLLLSDEAGSVRILELPATTPHPTMSTSNDSGPLGARAEQTSAKWIMSWQVPFHLPQESPAFARTKRILDATWVLGGRAIFVLLEDAEWGMWDTTGQLHNGNNFSDFALRGFLDQSSSSESVDVSKQSRTTSRLAPMTPNTRNLKADHLFSTTVRTPGAAAKGGISMIPSAARSAVPDESLILWYDKNVYAIPSMQNLWQRSSSGGRGLGSLYAPGLVHVPDIDLANENITSISQFVSRSGSNVLGQMKVVPDILISAEHRFIILHTIRATGPSRTLFEGPDTASIAQDQRMLDAGELDVGGMDRLLDSMADGGKTRRVGFAVH